MNENKFSFKHFAEKAAAFCGASGGGGWPEDKCIPGSGSNGKPLVGNVIVGGAGIASCSVFIHDGAEEVKITPQQAAAASLRNAKANMQQAIKAGALDDGSIDLIDQAEAIMQMVLDNLQKQAVPAEVSHRLANVVNELCACERLCSGEIKTAVYDLSVATERLRGRIA